MISGRRPLFVLLLALLPLAAGAQSARSLVRDGNGLYDRGNFADAEVPYRKALEEQADLLQGHFNLGNALHRQEKYDEAIRAYQRALGAAHETGSRAHAHYNIGNSHLKAEKFREAADAYIEALKINPDDQDAKYNLSYALRRLQQQQQDQQKQDQEKQDQEKQDQEKQDQEKQDQEKQDQQKQDQQKQDQQKRDQQQQDQQKQNPEKQQREQAMSRADAERILEVLKNAEQDIQKRLRARQAVRPKGEKDW